MDWKSTTASSSILNEFQLGEIERLYALETEGEHKSSEFCPFRATSFSLLLQPGMAKAPNLPGLHLHSPDKGKSNDYDRVYVVETKGLHLAGNLQTDYIRKIFDICT